MKTMTIEQFEELLKRDDWKHEQHIEIQEEDVDDDGDELANGFGGVYSTLDDEDIKITYEEWFSFTRNDPDSFEKYEVEFAIRGPLVKGVDDDTVLVVDEGGSVMRDHELIECLPNKFKRIDWSKLNLVETIDVDVVDEENVMTLQQHKGPTLRFSGDLVSEVSNKDYTDHYVWTRLKLYETRNGKYIILHNFDSDFANLCESYGEVCETIEEVREYLKDVDEDLVEELLEKYELSV